MAIEKLRLHQQSERQKLKLIDSHAHLDFDQFHDDFDDVLSRAHTSGVIKVINIGADLKTSQNSVMLASTHETIFASVGVHPDEVDSIDLALLHGQLIELAKSNPKVVAIGECGLDYYHIKKSMSTNTSQLLSNQLSGEKTEGEIISGQQDLFRLQIEVAKHLGLPLVVHIRNGENNDAAKDAYEILRESDYKKGVIHCFSLDELWAEKFTNLGFYLGFTGVVTYKNAASIEGAAKVTPLTKILIETDAPFLAPQEFRGKRNEPAYVVEVAKKIAELKNETLENVASVTTKNAETLFGL